jgi:hypothetical protein
MATRKRKTLTVEPALSATQPVIVPTSHETETPIDHPVWSFRWGWYLFSLFVPLAGIVIGFLFYDMESKEARKVGKRALGIGFFFWVVLPILFTLLILLVGGLALYSWISSVVGPTD